MTARRLAAAVRIALGAAFLWAAATKLPDLATFAETVANYRMLPAALVPAAAVAVVGVELAAGALLVAGVWARAAAAVSAGLLAIFTAGLSQALARGIDLRCGCFGGAERATWLTVGRDLVLLGAAVALAARPAEPSRPAAGHTVGEEAAHGGRTARAPSP